MLRGGAFYIRAKVLDAESSKAATVSVAAFELYVSRV